MAKDLYGSYSEIIVFSMDQNFDAHVFNKITLVIYFPILRIYEHFWCESQVSDYQDFT